MKVLHLNHSDINGGAARAAYRIHHALRDTGVDSTMWVNVSAADDWTVEGPVTKWGMAINRIRPQASSLLRKSMQTENPILHSPAILPSNWVKRINQSDADVVHLHWVQGEMLSIRDIGQIEKPIVWTLHDMWAFCGAEHYTDDFRWRVGYHRNNRPAYETGFDLNRWTWERKCKHWHQPMQIVTPSRWLADCVRESALMRDWPVSVIPNCLDTNRWKPVEQDLARELFGLPNDVPLLLFGAMGGGRDPRKGFDLLTSALDHLRGEIPELELVVFGQVAPHNPPDLGFPIHYTGHLHDDLSLRALYSAADTLVVPSRQEVFGQTASEAHACGTPVVAFGIGGLQDIIENRRTGYLAKAFDVVDLAEGIRWVLSARSSCKTVTSNEDAICGDIRKQSRERAVAQFSNPVVAAQYLAAFDLVSSI